MITGIYSSKEEIQLKAPTDLSLFERLKGSLKSFLSRHVTPQVYYFFLYLKFYKILYSILYKTLKKM